MGRLQFSEGKATHDCVTKYSKEARTLFYNVGDFGEEVE